MTSMLLIRIHSINLLKKYKKFITYIERENYLSLYFIFVHFGETRRGL